MALKYAPRVKQTTTTTGTGTYSLTGTVAGFQGFVVGVGDTNTTCYCCTDGLDWEIGVGTVTDAATDTLSRATILSSSNSGSAVNWSAGTRDVFCIFPPGMLDYFTGNSTGAFDNPFPYDCTISIGSNTLTGVGGSGVVIGNTNAVTASETTYVVGYGNTISETAKVFGASNTNAADACHIIGSANTNLATAPSSFLVGNNATNRYAPGSMLFSTNLNYLTGTFQTQQYSVAVNTYDATEAGIGYEWGPSSEFKQGALVAAANNTASLLYDILVLARQTDGTAGTVGDSKAWRLQAMALEAAGVLTQVGSTTTTNIAASAGASAWGAVLDFSDTFPIRVTGEADKDILWTANIVILEASIGYSA